MASNTNDLKYLKALDNGIHRVKTQVEEARKMRVPSDASEGVQDRFLMFLDLMDEMRDGLGILEAETDADLRVLNQPRESLLATLKLQMTKEPGEDDPHESKLGALEALVASIDNNTTTN